MKRLIKKYSAELTALALFPVFYLFLVVVMSFEG